MLPNGIVGGHGERRDGKRENNITNCQIGFCGEEVPENETANRDGIAFAL